MACHLIRSVRPGVLLLWERGLDGCVKRRLTLAGGVDFRSRTKANLLLPPMEALPDSMRFPRRRLREEQRPPRAHPLHLGE